MDIWCFNRVIGHFSSIFQFFSQVPQAPKKTTSASSRRNGQDDEASGGTASGTGQKVLLSDLQNFLSGLQAGNEGVVGGRNIDLASAINADALEKISTEAEQSECDIFSNNQGICFKNRLKQLMLSTI